MIKIYTGSKKAKQINQILLSILLLQFLTYPLLAQKFTHKVWERNLGGNYHDNLTSQIATPDGGYLLGGYSASRASRDKTEELRGIFGNEWDYWIVKINADGNKVWDKSFGGDKKDELTAIVTTPDGGFLLGGTSQSGISGDKSEAKGMFDYWVVKIDSDGNKVWDKSFGGDNSDYLGSMISTSDGGFLLAGGSGGDKTTSFSGRQFWVVKIDGNGNKIWDKSFGGRGLNGKTSLIKTLDGGYLLGGTSSSRAYWVIKLNINGSIVWENSFAGGTAGWDELVGPDIDNKLSGIAITADGGYLLAGTTNWERSPRHTPLDLCWFVKINSDGTKAWDKALPINTLSFNGYEDKINAFTRTEDGNYLVVGNDRFVKLNPNCDIIGAYTSYENRLTSIIETKDGGYLVGGEWGVKLSIGFPDYWVIKVFYADPPKVIGINKCGSGFVTLGASGAPDESSYRWYTTATGNTAIANAVNSTYTTPNLTATTIYYVSVMNTLGLESERIPVKATIIPLPAPPTVTAAYSYCQGTSVTALTATGTSLKWYTTAIGGTASTTAPLPSTTTAGTTKFYISQTANGCESPRAEITVTVNALPAAPDITGASNCGPGAVTLTATGSSVENYRWYTAASGGTAIANATNATFTTPTLSATTTYYVSVVNNLGCESARTAVTATINTIPTAPTVTAAISYCQGATATALTATGSNLKWYTTVTGGTASTSAPTPGTATVGDKDYYVTQTVNDCESARAKIIVTVNALPAAPVATAGSNCGPGTVTLTASGSTSGNYRWFTTAAGGTAIANATGDTFTTPVLSISTNYYVTIHNGSCESARTLVVAHINPVPTAPATAPVAYCVGETTTALTATGSNLKWYISETSTIGYTTAPVPSTATAGVLDYFVTQTTNGCESARTRLTVTVHALPTAPTVTGASSCGPGSLTLAAAGGAAGSLSWYTTPTGGFPIHTGNSYTTPSLTTTTTYYVASANSNCESVRTPVTATINPIPATPTVVPTLSLCQGVTATALTATGSNLRWYTEVTGGTASATAPAPGTATTGTTEYFVSQSVNGCESQRARIVVTVNAMPTVTLAAFTSPVCSSNTSLALTGGQPAGGTYSGTGVSNGIFNAATAGIGAHTITYSYTANGCTATATQNITVSVCTGIAESELAASLALYPNPVYDRLQIVLPLSKSTGLEVRLVDARGRVVLTKRYQQVSGEFNQTLHLKDKAHGMYMLQLITDDEVITKRIVKE